jgi:hypothetical protein
VASAAVAAPATRPRPVATSTVPNWKYRKHLRPLSRAGFYTGRMAAALLAVRALKANVGPLGAPYLRFGGQL